MSGPTNHTVTGSWRDAPLVALDLEGTGAQDRDHEAILEIAVVPIVDGLPVVTNAFSTMLNPGRPVPRRPWLSPGLTDEVLAQAPAIGTVEPILAAYLTDKIIVGHNVIHVDWRLLHRRCPSIQPAGFIDTLRLARHLNPAGKGQSLSANLQRRHLTSHVTDLAPASRPHRAMWDSVGAALLLAAAADEAAGGRQLTLNELLNIAGRTWPEEATTAPPPEQQSLFDL